MAQKIRVAHGALGQTDLALPGAAVGQGALEAAEQRGLPGGIGAAAAVGNAAVVAGDGEGGGGLPELLGNLSAGGGMVDHPAAVQAFLKAPAVFADVVQQPRKAGGFFPAEGAGELCGERGGVFQVFPHGLCAGVVF